MTCINSIDPITVNRWKANFEDEQSNLYTLFAANPILITRTIYEALCTDSSLHIRLYFGLTNDQIPRMIAVAATKLEEADAQETGYMDLLIPGNIYELYSGQPLSYQTAKTYTTNWEAYQANELWIKGFLIPRPNLIQLFLEAEEDTVEITLGIQKALSPMCSKEDPQTGDVYYDRSFKCPTYCSPDSRL
jgi:hypothetical protein